MEHARQTRGMAPDRPLPGRRRRVSICSCNSKSQDRRWMRKSLFTNGNGKRGPSRDRAAGSKFPGLRPRTPLHTPTRNCRSVSHPVRSHVVCRVSDIERNRSHKGKPHQRKCEQRKWHAHRHVKSHSTRSTIHVRPPSASRHGPALSQHSTLVRAVVLK